MLIPGGQGQTELLCDGGNPDIVFGYGAAFQPQRCFNLSIEPGGGGIAGQDGHGSGQFLDPSEIGAGLAGLPGAVVKLSQNCGGQENLRAFGQSLADRLLAREERNYNVGIKKYSTRHLGQRVHSLRGWPVRWFRGQPERWPPQI